MSANTTHKGITIRELRAHLNYAKSRLSHEKADIFTIFPLSDDFSREEYAFAYMRAEHMGMNAINRRLNDIAWLPMQIDPSSELLSGERSAMARWLNAPVFEQPDSDVFGNDFMHALTRAGMSYGWDDPHFHKLITRVAALFRDLSCLIGIIYYCTWLTEHGIDEVPLSNPNSLMRTATEIATFLQSSALYDKMQERAKDSKANENTILRNKDGGNSADKKHTQKTTASKDPAPPAHETSVRTVHHQNGASVRKQDRPMLRVITNNEAITHTPDTELIPLG